MKYTISIKTKSKHSNKVILASALKDLSSLSKDELAFVKTKWKEDSFSTVQFFNGSSNTQIFKLKSANEANRKLGFDCFTYSQTNKLYSIAIEGNGSDEANMAFVEGLLLSTYKFEKYKSKALNESWNIDVLSGINKKDLDTLKHVVDGNFIARDLVNEPQSYLNAVTYSKEIKKIGKGAGFSVKVFDKKKIESLKMGGVLAVNKGSIQEPTFNILEWKPAKSKNKKPLVLVGKGVVYDTGGLSLKPTANSMDIMKCDMAGSAAVVGAMHSISKMKLPIHVVALIPATDNRPGLDAVAPGDVITMYDGTSVEVLNTDAEGRLILADALSYAKKYKPELVIDLATLTGSAVAAIGQCGLVAMGTASEATKAKLKQSGENVYERLVEFPLWDEYGDMIKSDVADIKNLGGPYGGSITAGKFLQHFTDYPWMHFDIAGPAYLRNPDNYRGKHGTGYGVRLLVNYIQNMA